MSPEWFVMNWDAMTTAEKNIQFPFVEICKIGKMREYDAENRNRITKINAFYGFKSFYDAIVSKNEKNRLAVDCVAKNRVLQTSKRSAKRKNSKLNQKRLF